MQTVNFNCPHCGNLMAVGTNLLGRNVRCPHCKQVVRAPSTPGEPAPQSPVMTPTPPVEGETPTFNLPKQTEHHESIFGERHDEDVFGSEPAKPTMPGDAPRQAPPQFQETVQLPEEPPPVHAPPPLPQASNEETLPYVPENAGGPEFDPVQNDELEHSDAAAPPPIDSGVERERPVYRSRPVREEGTGTAAFAWILLVYSVMMTIAAGYFGYQFFTGGSKGESPYNAMPDVLRQYDPAKKPQVSFKGLPDPKLEIPDNLRVKLGDELTVGDLLVQPKSVAWQEINGTTKYVSGPDKTRFFGKSLVLTMRVKNLSTDTEFHPNDPAFKRALVLQEPAPFTALQIQRSFFYGTFKWPADNDVRESFIVGQEGDAEVLKPGEERETWATVAPPGARTSGSQDLARVIDELDAKQPVLWRVQLRRGLVPMKDETGKDIDVSATCVIGVEFQKNQITR